MMYSFFGPIKPKLGRLIKRHCPAAHQRPAWRNLHQHQPHGKIGATRGPKGRLLAQTAALGGADKLLGA